MKRFVSILFALLLLFPVSFAEDLSSMTFEELLSLRDKLTAEIMSRPEWKEVTVPAGTWHVGSDIPAGVYSVSNASRQDARFVCTSSSGKQKEYMYLRSDRSIGRIELEDGDTVVLSGAAIFCPPASLGF